MAGIFQSFRSSSMPKRLLRYALSRLDLLDSDALDLENLDLAWGRKTVFEFRDVGIILPKLEKLLKLPEAFSIQKAKVLLLRVTIPMDFYSSPITIEVDGVDVKLKVLDIERKPKSKKKSTKTDEDELMVPNTVDLAQSFLETQPSSEKKRLEEALAAETQDLMASATSSDDGSEEEPGLGTGQPLSLPTFLANFLQGIVDRMEIKIKGVGFQLDMEVPVDLASSSMEPVSFQIALEGIDIEGVTTKANSTEQSSQSITHKEGKRQISLENVRAFLISETNGFPSLTRSPSAVSSPFMTRNPPSREPSSLSQMLPLSPESTTAPQNTYDQHMEASRTSLHSDPMLQSMMSAHARSMTESETNIQDPSRSQLLTSAPDDSPSSSMLSLPEQQMVSSQRSFQEHMEGLDSAEAPGYPLGDSEDALGIPYDLEADERQGDESPATPRASVYQEFSNSPDEQQFHSPTSPDTIPSHLVLLEGGLSKSLPMQPKPDSPSAHHTQLHRSAYDAVRDQMDQDGLNFRPMIPSLGDDSPDDLARSQIYSHEQAESMYMSAFSQTGLQSLISPLNMRSFNETRKPEEEEEEEEEEERPETPQQTLKRSPDGSPQAFPQTSPPHSPVETSLLDVEEPSQSVILQSPDRSPTPSPKPSPSIPVEEKHESTPTTAMSPPAPQEPEKITRSPIMPGGWDEDAFYDSQPVENRSIPHPPASPTPEAAAVEDESQSSGSSPAFSRATLMLESSANIRESHEEQPMDDVATPKGPTRVVKEIFHLENISIYVPGQALQGELETDMSESVAELARSMGSSVYPQAPGAFSVHGAARGSSHLPPGQTMPKPNIDNSIEVNFSPMSIRFDASLAWMLAMIVGKLLEAVKSDNPVAPTQARENEEIKAVPEIKVRLQEITLDFLNHLRGVADTPRRYLDSTAFMFEHEVLLNATLENLAISVGPAEAVTQPDVSRRAGKSEGILTKIDLERFRFGYANGDIVAFDHVKPMSTSIRDTFLSSGHDVGIKITQTQSGTRTEIETLPLAVHIDLQRLDETFSWFGGLSSFLNMSASMTSSPAQTPKPAPPATPKPRGVRFDTPINPEDKSAASENKINLRIGGSYVEVQGKECSITAESNAIKLVSRDEGIGVACSMMRLSGPYLKGSMADPAINTEIGGVRVDFLNAPKDADLEKLLELITPSKAKFDDGSDEIMVDTLLRQRRKGSVLRASVEAVNIRVKNLAQLSALPNLGEEMAKLSTVAKYLPEDDRPGLLTLAKIHKLSTSVDIGGTLGHLSGELKELELGHISVPSLVAVAISGISVRRNKTEELINSSTLFSSAEVANRGPVIMARLIGDEIEPVVKLRLQDVGIEYRVPTIMDILGLAKDATPQDFEESLAASVASLGDQAHVALARNPSLATEASKPPKPTILDVGFKDCIIGLNPLNKKSKMVIALTDAHLEVILPKDDVLKTTLEIKKASILLTNDSTSTMMNSAANRKRRTSAAMSPLVVELCSRGFVDICYMSSASVVVKIAPGPDDEKQVDVEVRDDLFVLETCADSMQTLIALANALSPPTPPSKENKYRTSVVPMQDMLSSICAEAFGRPEGEYDFDSDFAAAQEMAGSESGEFESDGSLRIESQFYGEDLAGEELFDATKMSETQMQDTNEGVLISNLSPAESTPHFSSEDSEELVIHENFYEGGSEVEHNARLWNSSHNTYDKAPDDLVKRSPIKVSVKDVHFIWNLFDGYDWESTREVISQAVHQVEAKAMERQSRLGGMQVYEEEIEDEETIGDFLFNSIYIGIPANRDPRDLARAINEGFNDGATETESIAPSAVTATTNRTIRPGQHRSRRLKLHRSKHHKITFELQGVNMDLVVFPTGSGETQSSIDIRVHNLDVFDHIPTSTWRKFATYDQDKGEREMGTSMAHIQLLTVKPQPELGASEMVLRATVLPLRLHVDQDALDFITRFFEFKDDSVPIHDSPSDVPFVQRAEINDIFVQLDFKPKRVDYAGLRSGHTTEFMNFIVLQESKMILRRSIVYGSRGFERLGRTLQDIWTPDVKNNQLPGVVAGLAPVRSLVNITSGFRDLVEIPVREYQKDGRVIRSLSKGATAFARNTGTELIKLGAKIAVGTQYALQGAEGMLNEQLAPEGSADDDDLDPDERKYISLYADQPTGVIQGLRGGYRSLARDVNLARDAIVAVPGEIMESATPTGAAKALIRRTPTIIFRPAVGVTKAIGQTLLGATNSIDPHNQRRVDQKYKKY